MARCPRCLKPVDEESKCLDTQCSYRMDRDSLRPFWTIFGLVGVAHLALVGQFGVPMGADGDALGFWLFVGICWLFVNSAVSIVFYSAYVFAHEQHPGQYRQWMLWVKHMLRPAA